jgi:hypothetical protein
MPTTPDDRSRSGAGFIVAFLLAFAMPGGAVAGQVKSEAPQVAQAGDAEGKEVRVSKKDGTSMTGRLVSLNASGVVVRVKGQTETTQLNAVRRVERVSHHLRTGLLTGIGASAVIWTLIAADDDCADCEDAYGMGAVFTATAIGAGAGVGALLNRLTSGRHVLYASPPSARQCDVLPVATPRMKGVVVTLRW